MLQNKGVKNGFKPKPNYRRSPGYKREGTYRWEADWPVGVAMKIAVQLLAEEKAGSNSAVVITRNFKGVGIGGKQLRGYLLVHFPWFEQYFMGMTGKKSLPNNVVYDRMHKAFNEATPGVKGTRPVISREHYTNSEVLRPHVAVVERLIRRAEPISKEELIDAMGGDFVGFARSK